MYEFQRLRCRVSFHALQFRPEIMELGHLMVNRYDFQSLLLKFRCIWPDIEKYRIYADIVVRSIGFLNLEYLFARRKDAVDALRTRVMWFNFVA